MRGERGADTWGSSVRSPLGSLPPNLHQNEQYRAPKVAAFTGIAARRHQSGRRHRISAIASIREEFSKARVIVVTTFKGDEAIQRALTPTMSIIAQWNHVRELDPAVRWFIAQLRVVAQILRNQTWRLE
jgi:DNA-binding NarL/FixJ family response regulator